MLTTAVQRKTCQRWKLFVCGLPGSYSGGWSPFDLVPDSCRLQRVPNWSCASNSKGRRNGKRVGFAGIEAAVIPNPERKFAPRCVFAFWLCTDDSNSQCIRGGYSTEAVSPSISATQLSTDAELERPTKHRSLCAWCSRANVQLHTSPGAMELVWGRGMKWNLRADRRGVHHSLRRPSCANSVRHPPRWWTSWQCQESRPFSHEP